MGHLSTPGCCSCVTAGFSWPLGLLINQEGLQETAKLDSPSVSPASCAVSAEACEGEDQVSLLKGPEQIES